MTWCLEMVRNRTVHMSVITHDPPSNQTGHTMAHSVRIAAMVSLGWVTAPAVSYSQL